MNSLRNSWLEADDEHLLRDCVQDFHKASGKGGQKVNKTSSAVRLTHTPSGISVTEAENRSQTANRLFYIPSVSNVHAYAPWLAVLLDHLAFDSWDVRKTAERYGISPSKLVKIIFRDAELWQELNRKRAAAGLAPLRGVK